MLAEQAHLFIGIRQLLCGIFDMKSFLIFAGALLSAFLIQAAPVGNPGFADFNTNQFSTTGRKVSLLNGAVVTNLTFNTFIANGITFHFPLTNCIDGQLWTLAQIATNEWQFYCTNLPVATVVFDTIEELVATPIPPPGIGLLAYVRDPLRGGPLAFYPDSVEATNRFDIYQSTDGPGSWRRAPGQDIRAEWGVVTGFAVTNDTLVAALTLQSSRGTGKVIYSGSYEFLHTDDVPLLDNNVLYFEDGAQATGLNISALDLTNAAVYGPYHIAAVASPSTGAYHLTNSTVLIQSPKFLGYSGNPVVNSGSSVRIFTFDSSGLVLQAGNGLTNLVVTDASGYSGTGTNFLADDGTFKVASSGGGVANPSAQVGLTAVNGVATSAIRSDGAPSLSQAIVPTWSGDHVWSQNGGVITPVVIRNSNPTANIGGPGNQIDAGLEFHLTDGGSTNHVAARISVSKPELDWSGTVDASGLMEFWTITAGVLTPKLYLEDGGALLPGSMTVGGFYTVANGFGRWFGGLGSPEGVQNGNVGDYYTRADGGAGTSFYVKESGTGTTTGWVPVLTTSSGSITTINPTDGYAPYRVNSTTFGDSPWYRISTSKLGFSDTNTFFYKTSSNIRIGTGAAGQLEGTMTGGQNIGLGEGALWKTTIGTQNVGVGGNSLAQLTTGSINTAAGYGAGGGITSGSGQTLMGVNSGASITTGFYNSAFGYLASQFLTSSGGNSAFGAFSLDYNTGANNSAFGNYALMSNTLGTLNVAVGYHAANQVTNVSQSTFVGAETATVNPGKTNQAAFGYNATTTNDNQMVFGTTLNTYDFPGATMTLNGQSVLTGEGGVSDRSNVLWWGAIPDDGLDDVTAIQDAIDDEDSVYMPPGVFELSTRLDLRTDTRLIGAGRDVTILRKLPTHDSFDMIEIPGSVSNVLGADFQLDGMTSDTNTITQVGVQVDGNNVTLERLMIKNMLLDGIYGGNNAVKPNRVTIQDCLIENPLRNGVAFVASEYVSVIRTTVVGPGHIGVLFEGLDTNVVNFASTILDCRIFNAVNAGIAFDQRTKYATASGNLVSNALHGIWVLRDSSSVLLTRNTLLSLSGDGIRVETQHESNLRYPVDVRIDGNRIADVQQVGVLVGATVSNVVVSANTIRNAGLGGAFGYVSLAAGVTGATLAENHCSFDATTVATGFQISNTATNVLLRDNRVRATALHASTSPTLTDWNNELNSVPGPMTANTAISSFDGFYLPGPGGFWNSTSFDPVAPINMDGNPIGMGGGNIDMQAGRITNSAAINNVVITAPAITSTLTIGSGKTITLNNTMTLNGTDATTMTFPTTSATIARTDAGQTFTGNQVINGNITFTDNTYDIGASGATRPRDLYVANNGRFGNAVFVANTAGFFWTSAGSVSSNGDGVIALLNNAANNFGRLQLGGLTASFPAIARSTDYVNIVDGTGGATGGLMINSGTPVLGILSATAALDFGNILAATSADLTITVTGAATGDSVHLGLPAAPDGSITFNGFVSSANTVTVRAFNVGAIAVDQASATFRAVVMKF